jgi:hypothetical protein
MNNFIIHVRQFYNRPLMDHNFKKQICLCDNLPRVIIFKQSAHVMC